MRMHTDDSRIVMSSDTRRAAGSDTDGLRALARVAVARTLVAVDRGQTPNAEVRASLRVACNTARQRGLHAEHFDYPHQGFVARNRRGPLSLQARQSLGAQRSRHSVH